jgi:hypothetical protein
MGSFANDSAGVGATQAQGGALLEMFGDSIPTFFFQVVVGIYIVQITILLTQMLNTIVNGYDPLNEKYLLGVYVRKSGLMYCVIGFIIILLFNIIAANVISGLAVG